MDASLEFSLQIDLGWPLYADQGNAYVPLDENGNVMTGLKLIPVVEGNVGTTEEVDAANDFIRDSGIQAVVDELPGYERGVEFSMQMLEGTAEGHRGIDDPG